jgi:hypothetical protein
MWDPVQEQPDQKGIVDMAQVVEHQPSKCETLDSTPVLPK